MESSHLIVFPPSGLASFQSLFSFCSSQRLPSALDADLPPEGSDSSSDGSSGGQLEFEHIDMRDPVLISALHVRTGTSSNSP